MAEVGLVRFARVALGVAEGVLPDYRTKFSKRTFTQPQLLAVLCLMRYEDCGPYVRPRFGWLSMASCEALWAYDARRPTIPHSTVSLGGSRSEPWWRL